MNLPASALHEPHAISPARVLIVEDSATNAEFVLHLLGQEPSLSLHVARTGEEALKAVAQEAPDLILLDVMLPDWDGFALCQRLKSDPASRDIPVLFLTVRTGPEDIVHGFEVGGADYVTKPFEPLELRARVLSHLAQKRWADQERALVARLETALTEVKRLSGLIPICAHCKKVRDDQGYWQQVEAYVASHSEATFTHGICPPCASQLFPDLKRGLRDG